MKKISILLIGISILIIIGFSFLCFIYGPPTYIIRTLLFQDSGVYDFRIFPKRELHASPQPFSFKDTTQDMGISSVFESILTIENWETYLDDNKTQAFLVIQDDTILYEKYFNGLQRNSLVTSFSIAKSITSLLVGIAMQQGYIESVDDPITKYLPELKEEDFSQITLRNLLMMTSGLAFTKTGFFDGDEVKAYYYPDLRKIAISEAIIERKPGEAFLYNHYNPQLLGMILEHATGQNITEYLQQNIWDPIGMEYDGSWSLDSRKSGFEKMEAGLNARAVDFAKIGRLLLQESVWNGRRIISSEWVLDSTSPDSYAIQNVQYPKWFSSGPAPIYYSHMWWGYARSDGNYDYYAEGDKGQFLYVCPEKNLIIVRHGETYGDGGWNELFYAFCTQF